MLAFMLELLLLLLLVLVLELAFILFEHELTEIKKESWRIFDIDESKIETYEDMFYYTAFILYKTLFDLNDRVEMIK